MASLEAAPRPDWMDDDFLVKCIQASKNLPKGSNIDVNDIQLYYAVPKGENFMSLMYRVNIDYNVIGCSKTNDIHQDERYTDAFIVKASHEMKQMKDFTKEFGAFLKETDMYLNIMPKLVNTLENAGIDGNITGRCLHSIEGETDALVMEDLKPKGYVVANRLTGLDLPHTKLVFDKLAKMHAASMHYFSTHDIPELYTSTVKESSSGVFEKMKKKLEDSLHKKIAHILDELNKNPKYGKHIIEFYKKFDNMVLKMMFEGQKPIPGNKFNTLLHGDCWLNNMMFRYNDDGSVHDVLLIDLQGSHFSSVAYDFIYFFFSSVNDDVRKNHFNAMQNFYIDRLSHYLKKLGFTGEIPTLEEFDTELRRLMFLVIDIVTRFNVFVLAEYKAEDKDRSKSKAFELGEVLDMAAPPKRYIDVVLLTVEVLEENGYFRTYNLPDIATAN